MSLESKAKTTTQIKRNAVIWFGQKWVPLEEAQKDKQELDEAWFIKYNVLKEQIAVALKILDETLRQDDWGGTYQSFIISADLIKRLRVCLKGVG